MESSNAIIRDLQFGLTSIKKNNNEKKQSLNLALKNPSYGTWIWLSASAEDTRLGMYRVHYVGGLQYRVSKQHIT